MIPRRADCFQDRAVSRELDRAVADGGTVVLYQVLTGMGGVGKTQLAAQYARDTWDRQEADLLVWITAASRSAIVTGYAQAAGEILGADPAAPETAARAFLAWLEPRSGPEKRRWLVVLDDLANPADLRGLWPPAGPLGRTLITTRRREAALTRGRKVVDVGLYTPDEARAYLTEALADSGRYEPPDQVAALAAELGHLPLALAQAAAYLSDTGLGIAAYRERLAERALRDLLPDSSALPDDYPEPVWAAWALSVDRADRLPPAGLARPLLELTALLDPNGIPAAVLGGAAVRTRLSRAAGRPETAETAATAGAEEVEGALHVLHRLSLVDYAPDHPHQAVRVHQLIQRATREGLADARLAESARTAGDALVAAWPEVERDTALAQALRANAAALTECAPHALYSGGADGFHPVLLRTGRSLGDSGQVTAAVSYFAQLIEAADDRLSRDHPDTFAFRQNHAYWRGQAGDPAGATAAYAELLTDQLRVLGPEHPETLITRHHRARWHGEAGDPAGAAEAFAELVADQLRVLGPDDTEYLISRHNLARWRGNSGDPAGAAEAFAELVEDQLRVLGPDHLYTLSARTNLARWRGEAGDPEGAVVSLTEVLADQTRVLGPDHGHTLITRHHLARWRGKAGDPAGAVRAFTELAADRLRVLGPDHPQTFATRHSLAQWCAEAGDTAGAEAALAELLADEMRVLGPEHPYTIRTRRSFDKLKQHRTGSGPG